MDRDARFSASLPARLSAWSVLLLIAATLATVGCSLLPTIAYIIEPNDTKAEFAGLEKKKVAVICRAASIEYAHPTVGRDLAIRVGQMLSRNGKDIEVIDERELADWVDKHDWNDYREVGRALKADMVVGIDLERFEIAQGQTLLQGHAEIGLVVWDIKKNSKVWEKHPPTVKFPPNSPIAQSDRQEDEFRRQFLGVLSERIGNYFYAHDSRKQFASDSTVLQ